MEKSTNGIFIFLCEQMEKLDKKLISTEHLKQQANAAKQLNNVLKYELDKAKALEKFKDLKIKPVGDAAN